MKSIKDYKYRDDNTPGGVASSVHIIKRFIKAKEVYEANKGYNTPLQGVELVRKALDELLINEGLKVVVALRDEYYKDDILKFDYKKAGINKKKGNVVWIKFSDKGHVGVVASGADINFDYPTDYKDYTKQENGEWKYNSSGILLHFLGLHWYTDAVLIIPISEDCGYSKREVEVAVGNFLIDKGIPIIDYYSHNYGPL